MHIMHNIIILLASSILCINNNMKTSYILAHIHTRYVRMIRPSNEKVNFYTY